MVNYRENTVGAAGTGYVDTERLAERGSRLFYRFAKRSFDFTAALIALLLLMVPMLLIALIISIDSKGSPIFCQNRVGRGGKLFRIYKFRTMVTTAPRETPTCELDHPYSYITRFGAFLRKTSLDELPQLLNVLFGSMSFVGPRPLVASEAGIHHKRHIYGVYDVRPGLTGWAQINGRDDLSTDEKVQYDAEYVRRCSIGFDLKILLRTALVVLRREGYREGAQSSK
ncbi:MAG: sugar transferase [Ruminococcaceae bacterium]|nr:sugar transferase [Oscillospiraceae bacterium]